jgi:hypothetical protein
VSSEAGATHPRTTDRETDITAYLTSTRVHSVMSYAAKATDVATRIHAGVAATYPDARI